MEFLAALKQKAALVDAALDKYLPTSDDYPGLIHEVMRYSVMAGGKRLRPVLTLAAAEAVGGKPELVIPAACAMELIHTYSLVHDDLPAMDNDDYRRGKLTSHKVYGEAMAVLAGDALLTLAFQLLADAGPGQVPPERLIRVVAEVAAGAGTRGLIGGQVVDTLAAGAAMDDATLEYIHRHKTGALYRVAVRSGAILAGTGARELASLTQYAEQLGLAFQIVDDILDVVGDEGKIGKPVGSDEKNSKLTYPSLYGLAAARARAKEAGDLALASLDGLGAGADFLRDMVAFVLDRDF
ncbi:MAG: polyprenyl synthetase family protein [Bacillota bacterium]|jgi:geranylgeranyl diphosphate synthase type II